MSAKPFILAALFSGLALCGAERSHAQVLKSYGVKAGLVSADVSHSSEAFDEVIGRRTGFGVFAFAEWLDLPLASVVTEAGYVQRGFVQEGEVRTGPGEGGVIENAETGSRLDYLSFLALGKLRYDGLATTPYVLLGPRVEVLVNRAPGTIETEDGRFSLGFADAFDTLAAGGTAGVGVATTRLFPARLLIEARYDFDLTDSLGDAPADVRNNAFSVLIGVTL